MSVDQINIDDPLTQNLRVLIPDWVSDQIAQSEEYTMKDVFPSYGDIVTNGQHRHKFYPITAFCLVQLRAGATDRQWFRLGDLIRWHEQNNLGQTRDITRKTYWKTIDKLVDAGILKRVEHNGAILFALPPNRDVAAAFDGTHTDNIRESIVMNDPTPIHNVETTIWPLPNTAARPAVTPAQLGGGRLSNPWDVGLSFITLGVALTALVGGLLAFGDGTVTRPIADVLWAVCSLGIAAALVEVLDQVATGYTYSDQL
ncbi:hypothetical protein [Halorubrum coriense]|uniref:hypothetical protein n=1 Tax=Halorubrum coriense TaxID=64713 RepID=UPI001268FFDF|nr:hypothetical protein [Halorubrum coriense]